MVTLLDVAASAGVSRSTVSLVINKSPLVKDETRQRVERAIQELGYVPNPNARGLVKKENKSLGVIIAIEDQPYNTYEFNYETGLYSYNITNGIPVGLANTDYGLLTERFCVSIQGKELPALVKNNRVDGIFLVGGLFTPELIERLKEKKIPIIAIGRYYDQIDSVSTDVTQGAYLGVRYLLDQGYRKICYINCPQIYRSNAERVAGVQKAMREFHLEMKPDWLVYCKHNTGEGGYEAIKRLWQSGARPQAIAAANEPIALGIMRFLYEQDIRIPEDIAIVSYEDSVLGGYAVPALTSVNIQKEYMGELAARIMLKRIRKGQEGELEHIIVEPNLVVRSSVGKC